MQRYNFRRKQQKEEAVSLERLEYSVQLALSVRHAESMQSPPRHKTKLAQSEKNEVNFIFLA